jgi:capsular exopolysaccharide synthesis family protein
VEPKVRATEAPRARPANALGSNPAPAGSTGPVASLPVPGPNRDRLTQALQRTLRDSLPVAAPFADAANIEIEPGVGSPGGGRITYSRSRVVRANVQELARRHVVVGGAPAELVNAVKRIRTQVMHQMRQHGWRTLAICSPSDGEGKTLTAVNLAVSVAMEYDQTALLVDADLRAPSVHQYFGIPASPGLSNWLVNQAPLEKLLVNPGIDRLLVLSSGPPHPKSAELLGSAKMSLFVAEVRNRYSDRLVIFDLPPLLVAADALEFAPLADAVLLVVEEGATRREDVERARQLLDTANLIGVVLNKSREAVRESRDRPSPRTVVRVAARAVGEASRSGEDAAPRHPGA